MEKQWLTKSDIMKDLSKITGREMFNTFVDDYIVTGERPPPVRSLSEEDINELMGLYDTDNQHNSSNAVCKPDLRGIPLMLRMVAQHDDPQEEESPVKDDDDVIIISKFNPEAPEFQPKATKSSNDSENNTSGSCSSVDMSNSKISKPSKVYEDNISKCNLTNSGPTSATASGMENKTIESNGNSDDVKMLSVNELKNRISQASKCDSLKNKRIKNVAMASLLKLHMGSKESSGEHTVSNNNLEVVDKNQGSRQNEVKNAVEETPTIAKSSEDLKIDKSIDKVNKWLEQDKPKKPSLSYNRLFDKPIYKRKKIVNSPTEQVINKNIDSKVQKPSEYVPSKHVDELLEKYKQQSSVKESIKGDIWTNLEKELKERDEAKRKNKLLSLNVSSTNVAPNTDN